MEVVLMVRVFCSFDIQIKWFVPTCFMYQQLGFVSVTDMSCVRIFQNYMPEVCCLSDVVKPLDSKTSSNLPSVLCVFNRSHIQKLFHQVNILSIHWLFMWPWCPGHWPYEYYHYFLPIWDVIPSQVQHDKQHHTWDPHIPNIISN